MPMKSIFQTSAIAKILLDSVNVTTKKTFHVSVKKHEIKLWWKLSFGIDQKKYMGFCKVFLSTKFFFLKSLDKESG